MSTGIYGGESSTPSALLHDGSQVLTFGPDGIISGLGSKRVIQRLDAEPYRTYTATALVMAWDDNKPQITEGIQLLTQPITPTSATSRLVIGGGGLIGNSGSAVKHSLAIFQVGVTDALAAVGGTNNNNADCYPWYVYHEMVAGTTSEITFSLRFGTDSGTSMVNGDSSGRKYGGCSRIDLWVMEISE